MYAQTSHSYAVLEIYSNPKYKCNFYGKVRRVKPPGSRQAARSAKRGEGFPQGGLEAAWLISKLESSFKGHTVDALVLTGDEGRAKLR